jgi:hypothetical protein
MVKESSMIVWACEAETWRKENARVKEIVNLLSFI